MGTGDRANVKTTLFIGPQAGESRYRLLARFREGLIAAGRATPAATIAIDRAGETGSVLPGDPTERGLFIHEVLR